MLFYILDENGNPVQLTGDDAEVRFYSWCEANREARQVGSDRFGPYFVSTVFLGMDHAFGGPVPILWETMVFEPDSKRPWRDVFCRRYTTRLDAERGHAEAVAEFRAKLSAGMTDLSGAPICNPEPES